MRRILHIDMDAFYASVEQRDEPRYRGRPVIVGADPKGGLGRGVVAACSYEARAFGVRSALPIRQAWKRCPEGIFLRPRMDRYQAVSRTIMEVFRSYTDLVEPLSIDEAFLDVTGSTRLLGTAETIGARIKADIRTRTGLTASVGIAPNKFLAKIASELGKPDGLVSVRDDEIAEFLSPLPIRRLWGVGPRTGEKLEGLGLRTIGQLASMARDELVGLLGAHGEHLWNLAGGRDSRPVIPDREPRSISHETTFDEDVRDAERLRQTLLRLSDRVARRLRREAYCARTITLKLRYASFATYTRQASSAGSVDTGDEIFALVLRLFDKLSLAEPVRLVGVGASGLVRDGERDTQIPLFGGEDTTKRVARVIDTVRNKYGDRSIRRGSDLE